MSAFARFATVLLAALFATTLVAAMFNLGAPTVDLPGAVAAQLTHSGVAHPVAAVLLNFRGYDTLLEVAVLLLALLGILGVSHDDGVTTPTPPGEPVLQALARMAVPFMILTAGYLLWVGAHRPGGAFQAGVVLAAAVVLLNLARVLPAWTRPGLLLRLGWVSGFLIFLAVAAALISQGHLLQYPPAWAGALILLIEVGLTISIGLIMSGLFLLLTERQTSP